MYLPLIAVIALLLVAGSRLLRTVRTPGTERTVALGLAGAVCALFVVLTADGRNREAVEYYRTFIRLKPLAMGLTLDKLARYAEARDAFAAVVNQQPGNVAAHVNLASALASSGQTADAVREFRRAVELEPDPEAKRGLEQVIAGLVGSR